jgi:hypothetical protein
MVKIELSKKVIALASVLVLALTVVAISGVPARTQDNAAKTRLGVPSPAQGTPQQEPPALLKHVLNATYYDASSPGLITSCSGPNCTASLNLYTESISCPGPVGTKCTYEVNIAAQTFVYPAGQQGLYQFLIDGAIPSGGGTDANGFYGWEETGPVGQFTSAYAVTSSVKNVSTNQSHSIVLNYGCFDTLVLGHCGANSGFASLTVRVLKP